MRKCVKCGNPVEEGNPTPLCKGCLDGVLLQAIKKLALGNVDAIIDEADKLAHQCDCINCRKKRGEEVPVCEWCGKEYSPPPTGALPMDPGVCCECFHAHLKLHGVGDTAVFPAFDMEILTRESDGEGNYLGEAKFHVKERKAKKQAPSLDNPN